MPLARFEVAETIAAITMNRDAKRNAFNDEMATEVLGYFDKAVQEKCRVIVLRANPGAKVWCAGHDLTTLRPRRDANDLQDPLFQLFAKIEEVPMPVIAMVDGGVYGGGCELLMRSDMVIGSHGSHLAMTANKMGLPFAPQTYAYWLRVFGLHKVKEMFFTARSISAQEAYDAGIYNHLVAPEALESFTYDMAQQIMACSPDGIANSKFQLNLLANRSFLTNEDYLRIEESRQALFESPGFRNRLDALIATIKSQE